MTGSTVRPLLFLDVDGPLIPFGSVGYQTYRSGNKPSGSDSNPLLARIDPALGPRLLALPCELVWATTWMVDANECIAPRLGLPELPVMIWPEPSDEDQPDERVGLHWKSRALVDWAAGRAFAWVDDEITATDRSWVSAHHGERALLHRVDSHHGLTESDFGLLKRWFDRL